MFVGISNELWNNDSFLFVGSFLVKRFCFVFNMFDFVLINEII